MITMEKLLTAEEVSKILGFHVDHVKRLLRDGKLPGYKIEGSWRVNQEELQQYLKNRKNIK